MSKDWKELSTRRIERALGGDRRELDTLVQWYGPVVWGAVAARVRRFPRLPVELEDLVGEVWVELLRKERKRLRYYDPERGPFGFFIRMQASQIAGQLATTQLRGAQLFQQANTEAVDEGSERRMLDRDLLERLAHQAKATLSESDWLLFWSVYVEGRSLAETARRLDKHDKTVYQQKYRLNQKLERLVDALLAERGVLPERRDEPILELVVMLVLLLSTALEGTLLDEPNARMRAVDIVDDLPLEPWR